MGHEATETAAAETAAARAAVERERPRGWFPLAIETAEIQDERMVVRGWANTFGVMRSRRILSSKPLARWIRSKYGKAGLPILYNHEQPCVGRWTGFEVDPQRGMRVEGWIGQATQTARDVRGMLREGVLTGLSLGWNPIQTRWVTDQDKDLDPQFREALAAEGVREALAFIDWEPVEISLVDVPDDRDALLAARAGAAPDAAALAQALAAAMREPDLRAAWIEAATAACAAHIERLRPQIVDLLADNITSQVWDRLRGHLGEAYLDGAGGGDEDGCAAHGPGPTVPAPSAADVQGLTERLARIRV